MTSPDFVLIVRAALDDYDSTEGRDHWIIRDAERFATLLLTHVMAASLAVPPQVTFADIERGAA